MHMGCGPRPVPIAWHASGRSTLDTQGPAGAASKAAARDKEAAMSAILDSRPANTDSSARHRLLLTRAPEGLYAGSVAVALLLAASSLLGLAGSPSLYDVSPSALVSRGGDAANLLVTVPALLACLWAVRRGSLVGLLLWPGALFYAVYISAIYVVAGPFTLVLLGHLAAVVIGGCVIVALLSSIDNQAVRRDFAAAPARWVGGALIVIAVAAYAGLFANAFPALTGATGELGFRGQWAVDAALGTPVLLVGGVLLWRRASFGYVLAAPLLFVSGIGGLAFAAAAALDRVLGGAAIDPAVIGVHLAILAVDVVLLAAFTRHRSPRPAAHTGVKR
jgi:hypothetical protein